MWFIATHRQVDLGAENGQFSLRDCDQQTGRIMENPISES
jgi:hypothetical protein